MFNGGLKSNHQNWEFLLKIHILIKIIFIMTLRIIRIIRREAFCKVASFSWQMLEVTNGHHSLLKSSSWSSCWWYLSYILVISIDIYWWYLSYMVILYILYIAGDIYHILPIYHISYIIYPILPIYCWWYLSYMVISDPIYCPLHLFCQFDNRWEKLLLCLQFVAPFTI